MPGARARISHALRQECKFLSFSLLFRDKNKNFIFHIPNLSLRRGKLNTFLRLIWKYLLFAVLYIKSVMLAILLKLPFFSLEQHGWRGVVAGKTLFVHFCNLIINIWNPFAHIFINISMWCRTMLRVKLARRSPTG